MNCTQDIIYKSTTETLSVLIQSSPIHNMKYSQRGCEEVDELDSSSFDVVKWSQSAVMERSLSELMTVRGKYEIESGELDSELQQMVYTNYSNFATGTRLIGGLKDKAKEMKQQLDSLQSSIGSSQKDLSEANGNTEEGAKQVQHLIAITATLAGVQLLLALPTRLKNSLENNELDVGVRLWVKGRTVLQKHIKLPSLVIIREQCQPIVDSIEAKLWSQIDSCDVKTVLSAASSLRLAFSSMKLSRDLLSRIAGGISMVTATELSKSVPQETQRILIESTKLFTQCAIAADLDPEVIVSSLIEIVSPLIASHVEFIVESVENSNLTHSEAATTISKLTYIISCIISSETMDADLGYQFAQTTLSEYVCSSLVSQAFIQQPPPGIHPTVFQNQQLTTTLTRGIILKYLSTNTCLQEGGFCGGIQTENDDSSSRVSEEHIININPVLIQESSFGLNNRYAKLKGLQVERKLFSIFHGISENDSTPEDAASDSDESSAVAETIKWGPTSSEFNSFFSTLSNDMSLLCNSESAESSVKRVATNTLKTIVALLRELTIQTPSCYNELLVEIAIISELLSSWGFSSKEITLWRESAHKSIRERFLNDLSMCASEEDVQTDYRDVIKKMIHSDLIKDYNYNNISNESVHVEDPVVDVVKKIPLPSNATPAIVEDVIKELSELRKLTHKNIVSVLNCFHSDDNTNEICLQLQHINGCTLGSIARRSPHQLSEVTAGGYVVQVVSGLIHLHACGIVHGDIKGDSVIVCDKTGTAKLAGFAKSKTLQKVKSANNNGKPAATGTPLWMAPEVVTGSESTTESDVWSLGILTCEVLCNGRPPWPNFSSVVQTLLTIGNWSEVLPPNTPSGISKNGEYFLRSCLSPSKSRRWMASALLHHPWLRTDSTTATDGVINAAHLSRLHASPNVSSSYRLRTVFVKPPEDIKTLNSSSATICALVPS